MKKVKIKNITSEHYEGDVYNLELETLENADDLYWIDGNSGLISHNCFPKDVKALIKTGNDHGKSMNILSVVDAVNDAQKIVLLEKFVKLFGKRFQEEKMTIGIWGLSFKPNTDDMREAPSINIIHHFVEWGAKVKVYDPVAMENAKAIFGDTVEYCKDKYSVTEDITALMVLTEWPEFKTIDLDKLKKKMKEFVIFDGRNIYDKKRLIDSGFTYIGIGR